LLATGLLTYSGILSASDIKAAGNSDDPRMMPYYTGAIIPVPHKVEYFDKYLSLKNTGIVLKDVKKNDPRLMYLLERISRYSGKYEFTTSPGQSYSCVIHINTGKISAPPKAEGYAIKTEGENVYIQGSDFRGLLWAFSSLNQMIFIDKGKTLLRTVEISDWPDTPIRGMLGDCRKFGAKHLAYFMFTFKLNTVDLRWLIKGSSKGLIDKSYKRYVFNEKVYIESLNELKKYLGSIGIEWYVGGSVTSVIANEKKDAAIQLNMSNDKDLDLYYEKMGKHIAEAGGNLDIQLDDIRFPLHPDDVKKYGTAGKADTSWILRYYNKLKKLNPDIKVLVCPVFYWGPESFHSYSENRDEYLRTMGKSFPEAIDLYWTGPRVKGCKTKKEHVEWFSRLTRRKPFIFQNGTGIPHIYLYHYGSDPVYNLDKWYYNGYLSDIKAYFLNGGNMSQSGVLASISQWVWNTSQFNPEKTIRLAMETLLGAESWPKLVKLNKLLSFFDKYYSTPVSPHAMLNAKSILGKGKELSVALKKFKSSVPGAKNGIWYEPSSWGATSFVKNVKKAMQSGNMSRFANFAQKSREYAAREAAFDPGKDIFLSAMDFGGGKGPKSYKYKNTSKKIDIQSRFCTWIFGAQSPKSSLTAKFEISPFPPSGDYKLIISGLDDDSNKKCKIKISLNGRKIYQGENPFDNKNWSRKEFTLPAEHFLRYNTLVIANIEDSSNSAGPPFFMLNYAVIRKIK